MTELHALTLTQQINGLSKSKFSSKELISTYFNRINEINPKLNCFITIQNEDSIVSINTNTLLEELKESLDHLCLTP